MQREKPDHAFLESIRTEQHPDRNEPGVPDLV